MEQEQQPFAIQLQQRELTLSQRRPHPYLLHSPNSGNTDSSGYSSASSRSTSRRTNSYESNNLDLIQNSQPQQQSSGFFEAYDCQRCGNIHKKGTICNVFLSPVSRPQSRDSYSSGLSSGPLPALPPDEIEDHEMDARPCQSEPLNLAVALKEMARPPSRALRLTVNTDLQPQAKARLPAKIRLKAQLVSTNSAQAEQSKSSKPSLRVKKLKDLMSPHSSNKELKRQLQSPIAPMIAESEQTSSMADALPSVSSAINSLSMSEKQQFQSTFSNTTKATVTTCDDLIEISDDVTNDSISSNTHSVGTAVSTGNGNENSCSPKPATSIFAPDPKIEMGISMPSRPYLEIVEQPASNSLRFRYRCEGRSAGTLHGASTTGRYSEIKTYPRVQIHGFQGPARVAISCVEADLPYRCHPHNIVGKNCTKGICIVNVDELTMTATIPGIGIQCVKKKDMGESIKVRKQIGIDPFKQGFEEIMNDANVNLNAIRLAFQAFLDATGASPIPLEPIVSQVIKDKKAYCDLAIVDISDNWSPVEGGKKILLFSKKICRTDIELHISYTNMDNMETKTFKAPFRPSDVHEQCGISFRTPPFPDQLLNKQVLTQLCLYKPSDFTQSEPVNFYYYPKDDSVEEFEPLSADEGVDTNDIPENDQEQDDVVPMLEIDQTPCDEDYDNYDSERILQIDESIEDEPTEESVVNSVSNLIDFFVEDEDPRKPDIVPEKKPAKVVIEPRKPITVSNVLNMSKREISSLFQSKNGTKIVSRKKKATEYVQQSTKKPYHMPILVDLEQESQTHTSDSGFGQNVSSNVSSTPIENLDQMDIL